MTTPVQPSAASVLVSDFDSTMTRHDFYILAKERLISPDTPDYWKEYRSGQMTHFEALRAIFASIRADESTVLDVVRSMELEPELPAAVKALRQAGWEVVVASAGCKWYIQRLLAENGVSLTVYANPGHFEEGRGLLMSQPPVSPYYSPTLGVNKAAVVREQLRLGQRVAFAGDGYPDVEAARLVPAELRFARGALAATLKQDGLAFERFERWSQIAARLQELSQR